MADADNIGTLLSSPFRWCLFFLLNFALQTMNGWTCEWLMWSDHLSAIVKSQLLWPQNWLGIIKIICFHMTFMSKWCIENFMRCKPFSYVKLHQWISSPIFIQLSRAAPLACFSQTRSCFYAQWWDGWNSLKKCFKAFSLVICDHLGKKRIAWNRLLFFHSTVNYPSYFHQAS